MLGRLLVHNPRFIPDTMYLLDLEMESEGLMERLREVYGRKPTSVEKLITLIDRIEFIHHLDIVSQHAAQLSFEIDGNEVVGIDRDIAALRLYLALSCVDIFAVNFEPFQQWILARCNDRDEDEEVEAFLERKVKQYQADFLMGPSFVSAFTNAPSEITERLESHLHVVSKSGLSNEIEAIGRFLFRIRNKYTHEGRRFHQFVDAPIAQLQTISSRSPDSLMIDKDFDLVDAILQVAKSQARTKLGLY